MTKRIAILGAGPIGVEAAVLATQYGHEVTVYEQGAVGANVARWSHVQLFSPWKLNRSAWGAATLREAGLTLADDDDFPTGGEFLRSYLHPLVEQTGLTSRIRNLTTVTGVTRRDALKQDLVGKRDGAGPFVVVANGPDGRSQDEYDVVFDATGVYGQPAHFGVGGLPADGELALEDFIERRVPDATDRDRALYAAKTVLVIGQGYSAVTTVASLLELSADDEDTKIVWCMRDESGYELLENDPLPARYRLGQLGNRAAAMEFDAVECIVTTVERIERDGERIRATLGNGESRTVDRVVSNVGYRPDTSLTRELQVHYCYASEGIMKLAATLTPGADCLAQAAPGLDTLRSPEPDFWVLGNKSYGRNASFLLRVGHEQVEAILANYA